MKVACSIKYTACVSLLFLALASGASGQTAVEYGVLGSKSSPAHGLGQALGRSMKPLSEPGAAFSDRDAPRSQTRQRDGQASSPEATGGSKKFTIYSSEGVREIDFDR